MSSAFFAKASGWAPVRVAFVLMKFPVGSETFVSTEVRALQAHGWSVSCYPLQRSGSKGLELMRERGIDPESVYRSGWLSKFKATLKILGSPAQLMRFSAWLLVNTYMRPFDLAKAIVLIPSALDVFYELRRDAPDVVHIYWGHYPALVGRLFQQHEARPGLTMFLGAYDLERGLRLSGSVGAGSDSVLTHARYNETALRDLGIPDDRIRIVYRGVDVDYLQGFRDSAGVRESGKLMLSVGRLVKNKGHQQAVELLASLRQHTGEDWRLQIIGDGPDRAFLEEWVRKHHLEASVCFRGLVPHQEVLGTMARSDMLVIASRCTGERLPNVVKEAMFLGALVVSSASPGIEELVEDGVDGLVVDFSDGPAVRERVLTLLDDEDALDRVRVKAKEKIRGRFSARQTVSGYIQAWEGK